MLKATAAAVVLLLLASPAQAGSKCDSLDLMPAFQAFLAATAGETPAERAQAFAADFAPRYPDYYARSEFGGAEEVARGAALLLDPEARKAVPPLADFDFEGFVAMGSRIGTRFDQAQTTFLGQFRDFRCDDYVAFGPSLFRFDGHTYRGADGRTRLLFGVDLISMIHQDKDLPLFFDHELFHIYQDQVVGPQPPEGTVWWAMWKEGLATYVSARMAGGDDPRQALWMKPELLAELDRRRAELAGTLLADLDGDEAAYGRWFNGGGRRDGRPSRAGYYLGYLFAAQMGRDRVPHDLARLRPEVMRPRIEAFLRAMANQGAPKDQ
jgi:hypothetical protein